MDGGADFHRQCRRRPAKPSRCWQRRSSWRHQSRKPPPRSSRPTPLSGGSAGRSTRWPPAWSVRSVALRAGERTATAGGCLEGPRIPWNCRILTGQLEGVEQLDDATFGKFASEHSAAAAAAVSSYVRCANEQQWSYAAASAADATTPAAISVWSVPFAKRAECHQASAAVWSTAQRPSRATAHHQHLVPDSTDRASQLGRLRQLDELAGPSATDDRKFATTAVNV